MVLLCKLRLVAASRSYMCAQDGLDTVQLSLVVFFLGALAHLLILMCTQMNRHILQLALCGGGCIFMWWWLYVVMVICGFSGCT